MLQRAGLWTLSLGYRLTVAMRNAAFDRAWKTIRHAAVPIVSVGNLTTGGTGKTPCVEYVARFYRQLGLQVTLLSRGYGSDVGRNDEALVLEENLPDVPHLQGADRAALATTAVEELESDVLVLDDGFQHRQLHRDLDIVLIDATCPWGYGYLLPRGLLREPVGSMRRAHAVLLTRCDLVPTDVVKEIRDTVAGIKPDVPIAESMHRPAQWRNAAGQTLAVDALKGRPIAGFCGLGNPQAYRQTLERLGLEVIAWRTFPDHHPYAKEDIEALRGWARQLPAEAAIVTSQKDLVKIRLDRLGDRELWALRIELALTSGQDALEDLLRKVVARV
ncbi:MAG: tetraacyldisaccharide 4'-kinase [Planctomycetes bacterium]|nr:tetraacyldisaccharide 4'-kinase [Planctomycetota bacterium]